MAAAPKLPASIRVGYQDILVERASKEALEDSYGDYHSEKQLIRIGDWLTPQKAAETMIHELDHAMWPTRWTLVGDVEETFVSALAPVQAQVMRDNTELFAWLAHSLSKSRA